jgi:hypothetical protein
MAQCVTQNTLEEAIEHLLLGRLAQMNRDYIRSVNRDLTQHKWAGILSINIQGCIQTHLDDLKPQLLNLNASFAEGADKFKEITLEKILALLHEFTRAAVNHNRTSCALSNFGAEHKPDQGYLDEIAQITHEQLVQFLRAF